MRIGVDFDNTIVCHDPVIYRIACERNLVPADLPAVKEAVRDHLRRTGREDQWTAMQGLVYGPLLREAPPFHGVLGFLARCRREGAHVSIVSHRTLVPIVGPAFDLHGAARDWLREQGFLSPAAAGLTPADIHMETSKEAKLERIARLGCTHFVDDLPEFLGAPGFPAGVQRILFDPHGRHSDQGDRTRAGSWCEIEGMIFGAAADAKPPAEAVAALLAEAHATDRFLLSPIPGGANNRVYRVDAGRFTGLLKWYFRHPNDPRDRLGAEFEFCRFAWEHGVQQAPRPLARDAKQGLALYEFICGESLQGRPIGDEEIAAAVRFYRAVNAHRDHGRHLPAAAEACFSPAEHLSAMERRVGRLEQLVPEDDDGASAARFVREDLRPAYDACRETVLRLIREAGDDPEEPLPVEERRLSPSDFGFHNALRESNGRLRFLDFEYAGWDDPAKTICDFFYQPAIPAPRKSRESFARAILEGTRDPAQHERRVAVLDPVYRVKWCTILLNEFLAAGGARRRFAGAFTGHPNRRAEQLEKARALLREKQS